MRKALVFITLFAFSLIVGAPCRAALQDGKAAYFSWERLLGGTPELSRVSKAVRGAAGIGAVPPTSRREWEGLAGSEQSPRARALFQFKLAESIAGSDPSRALEVFASPSIVKDTGLAPVAAERVMDILEASAERFPVPASFFREIDVGNAFPDTVPRRYFWLLAARRRFPEAAQLLKAMEGRAVPAPSAWMAYAKTRLSQVGGDSASVRSGLKGILSSADSTAGIWFESLEWGSRVLGGDALAALLTREERVALARAFLAKGEGRRAWACAQRVRDSVRPGERTVSDEVLAGRAAWMAGRYAEAESILSRLKTDTEADEAARVTVLGLVARRAKREDRMASFLKEARALKAKSPEYPLLLQGAAFSAEVDGDEKEWCGLYAEISSVATDPEMAAEALWKTGWAEYLEGDFPAAAAKFLKSSEVDPGKEFGQASLFWYGVCLVRAGRQREGVPVLAAFVRLMPYAYYSTLAKAFLSLRGAESASQDDMAVFSWMRRITAQYFSTASPDGLKLWETLPDTLRRTLLELVAIDEREDAVRLLNALGGKAPSRGVHAMLADLYRQAGDTYRFIWHFHRGYPDFFCKGIAEVQPDLLRDLYPYRYADVLKGHLKGTSIDEVLVLGLIRIESAFRTDARSVSNAIGLMQLLPSTAASMARVPGGRAAMERRLEDPAFNLSLGCRYLQDVLKMVDGRVPLALASYNGGPGRIRATYRRFRPRMGMAEIIEMIPMAQSRTYAKHIFRNINYYSTIYRGKPADLGAFFGEAPGWGKR